LDAGLRSDASLPLTLRGDADILAPRIQNATTEGTDMWILKNLAWLAIMVLVVGFAILNVNGRASEIRLPGVTYANLPLTFVLFAAFALGMFLAFLLTLVNLLKGKAAMGKLTRELESLKQELRALRNLPLEDLKTEDREQSEA